MSWQDRYTKVMRIRTGDGKYYSVHTLPSFSLEEEYHGTGFEFIDIDLPLIKKRKLKSREFPLEFFFINADHLDEAAAFRVSSANTGPWQLSHPYYDNVLCQVLGKIKYDDSDGNITKVTCVASQTISDGTQVKFVPNLSDLVEEKFEKLRDTVNSKAAFDGISTKEVGNVRTTTAKNYNSGVKIIKNPIDAENYFNAFSKANAAINNIAATPSVFMTEMTSLILAPAQFKASVQDRMRILNQQYQNFRALLTGLTTVAAKNLYQLMVTTNISSMAKAATTAGQNGNLGIGPIVPLSLVANITTQINTNYRQFKSDLGDLQGLNSGNPLFFMPNFDVNRSFNDLINFSTSVLPNIALNGRKEIFYTLTEDSNVILLTHRFYGLDSFDNNIKNFIEQNKIRYEEIALGLKRGRTIVYYKNP